MSRWVGEKASEIMLQRGEAAEVWLSKVDQTIERFARERGYELIRTLEGGTVNAVVLGRDSEGNYIVVKAAMSERSIKDETRLLRELGPGMAPRVLDYEGFCMAMELVGGDHDYGPQAGAEAVATLMKKLESVEFGSYMPADIAGQYTRAIERLAWGDKSRVVEYEKVWEVIADTIEEALSERAMVVHGDLWRSNILVGENGSKFIDPCPRVAAKGYDIGYWVSDPNDEGPVGERLSLVSHLSGVSFVEGLAFAAHFAGHHLGWWERFRGGEDLSRARMRFDETVELTHEVFRAR